MTSSGESVAHGGGQVGPGAGAAAAAEEAVCAEPLVRGGHGGPADVEGLGQLALGGEPRVQRQPAVEDQQADPAGQPGVGGVVAAPVTQDPGEVAAADPAVVGRHGGGHGATFAELAME